MLPIGDRDIAQQMRRPHRRRQLVDPSCGIVGRGASSRFAAHRVCSVMLQVPPGDSINRLHEAAHVRVKSRRPSTSAALRSANVRQLLGKSPEDGVVAPSTRTGMIRMSLAQE